MIALIFCGDRRYCPYALRYIEQCEKNNVDYEFVYWNRSNIQGEIPSNYRVFESTSSLNKNKVFKFFDFYLFRKWVIQYLEETKPDKCVLLSTLTGVMISGYLIKNNIPYSFDVRDYSYEHIPVFKALENRCIKNSQFTAISSPGFKSFLLDWKYIIAHNFNRADIETEKRFHKCSGKIHIVWLGVIRYFDFQKHYIDAFANDKRFELIYHGDGPELEKFKQYCYNNKIKNVIFTGAYDNINKLNLLQNADILNNAYGYERWAGNKLRYAISNKFYDGIIFHIPQLSENEGVKSNWINNAKLGVSFCADNKLADKLFNYYYEINEDLFDDACAKVLEQVLRDDDEFISAIEKFILG